MFHKGRRGREAYMMFLIFSMLNRPCTGLQKFAVLTSEAKNTWNDRLRVDRYEGRLSRGGLVLFKLDQGRMYKVAPKQAVRRSRLWTHQPDDVKHLGCCHEWGKA